MSFSKLVISFVLAFSFTLISATNASTVDAENQLDENKTCTQAGSWWVSYDYEPETKTVVVTCNYGGDDACEL